MPAVQLHGPTRTDSLPVEGREAKDSPYFAVQRVERVKLGCRTPFWGASLEEKRGLILTNYDSLKFIIF